MRVWGIAGFLLCLGASGAAAQEVRVCDEAIYATAQAPDEESGASFIADMPPVTYPYGTHTDFDFVAGYVVDETGHVACVAISDELEMTPERRAFFEALSKQTFPRPVVKGQPARIYEEIYVREEERPPYHVMRPEGDATTAVIKIENRGSANSGPGEFTLTIGGDGKAVYEPGNRIRLEQRLLGPQTYEIPPQRVSAMLDMAETADFWSLRDIYMNDRRNGRPMIGAEGFYTRITITLGGRTKSLEMHTFGGAPAVTDDLIYDFARLGNAGLWWEINDETITQLARNGFDFTSERAGKLLVLLTAHTGKPDALVNDLIQRGAPQNLIISNYYQADFSLLDAAIMSQRASLVDRLLRQGFLLTNGKPDPEAATRALYYAAKVASPELVHRIASYGPRLVLRQTSGTWVDVNAIITLVGTNNSHSWGGNPVIPLPDQIAVVQKLLAMGADINDVDEAGRSLLDNALEDGDSAFAGWLTGQGAVRGRAQDPDAHRPLRY